MQNSNFTLLPMTQRFSLEPGKTYEGTLSIVNPADATENFSYQASIMPYGVSGTDYTADLATQYNRSMITKWITIEEPTGEVKPNETKELKFTINVPSDAPAGGQYAAIAIASNPEASSDQGVNVQSVFELASIVYAKVDGETTHGGKIIENSVPGFSVSEPITLSALISNTGNIHEDATFTIAISDVFSGRVILPNDENEGQYSELIMPETTRLVEREITNLPAIGIVKVNQTIHYQGETSTVEKNIIICPIWFMILVVLTLIAIIATIVMIVKKHKKAKKTKKTKKADSSKE